MTKPFQKVWSLSCPFKITNAGGNLHEHGHKKERSHELLNNCNGRVGAMHLHIHGMSFLVTTLIPVLIVTTVLLSII